MDIIIKEVKSKSDLKDFIHLPEKIHSNHREWLPALLMDEQALFSKKRNPAFKNCKTIMLLAMQNNKPVGRIMGIINHHYNQLNNENNARFSFIETYNDDNVFMLLINSIKEWAKNQGCDKLVGPLGFSDKEPQGFLLQGYDQSTVIITNCSFPYMIDFIERSGFKKHIDLVEYQLPVSEQLLNRMRPFADRCTSQHQIQLLEFTSTRKIKPFIHDVFNLINQTYVNIYGFSPVSDKEADEFANRYLPMLNPRLIKLILDNDNQLIAFIVAMPDISTGIKKARGRLLPFGWFHILRAMKSDQIVLLLGAIDNNWRHKGLDALMGYHLIKSAKNLGFKYIDSHLIMESNYKMRREIERLDNHKLYKRYRIYITEL